MNLRQAAQQALDALEKLWEGGFENLPDATHERVMEQLSAALAEPQTTHWEGCEAVHPECKTEQEPISLNNGRLTQYPDGSIGVGTPTPRKPLTDDEIEEINRDLPLLHMQAERGSVAVVFARAIERAHGIGEQHE